MSNGIARRSNFRSMSTPGSPNVRLTSAASKMGRIWQRIPSGARASSRGSLVHQEAHAWKPESVCARRRRTDISTFGAAPSAPVPDNCTKTQKKKALRYDVQFKRSYAELAEHYS